MPPGTDLRLRVLAAVREARREAVKHDLWLDAAIDSAVLRHVWRLAMLAAILAHLWVGSEGTRAARRWRLIPEPTAAAIGVPGALADETIFGIEDLP